MTAQANIDSKPISLPFAGDMSTSLFRFGKLTSTGVTVCTVQGEKSDGVIGAMYTAKTIDASSTVAGNAGDLYTSRAPIVEAGGVVAAGVDVTTDALGRAIAAGAGDTVNGRSVDATTAAGQMLRILPPYAKPSAQTVVDGAVSPATIQSGSPVVISLAIPDAATTTYSYINAEKLEIVDVVVLKSGAGAANTIQIQNAAATNISDAIAAAVDKAVTRAGTLDPAQSTLAAAAGFKVVATRAAGVMTAQVLIYAIKRT